MTRRNLLAVQHLDEFRRWVISLGYEVKTSGLGNFQVLGIRINGKLEFIYRRLRKPHLTVTTHLESLVKDFYAARKEVEND